MNLNLSLLFPPRTRARATIASAILALLVIVVPEGRTLASARSSTGTISSLVSHMTNRQLVGQMVMVSFAGPQVNRSVTNMLKTVQPSGVTLFGDNFQSPGQLKSLDRALQQNAHIPLFISTDQEGGEVIRVTSGVKQMQSEAAYGQQDNPAQLKSDAATEGKQLGNLGINMNLAPVLDVATPSSIIGNEQRSFGDNANIDSALGLAAISGYQSHGVAATAKHVLGLGTTSTNPETTLPVISLTNSQLNQQLLPFKKAAQAGVDSMMVTHVVIKGVTASTTPASLSYKVVTGILRNQLGFKGVIMTDSLTMGAIQRHFGMGKACTMSIQAGEDILLIAAGGATQTAIYSSALNSVIAMVDSGKITRARLVQSVTRILRLKQKLGLQLPSS